MCPCECICPNESLVEGAEREVRAQGSPRRTFNAITALLVAAWVVIVSLVAHNARPDVTYDTPRQFIEAMYRVTKH